MPAAVDWSWGQAIHSPTPFISDVMLPQDPHTNAWPSQHPSAPPNSTGQADLWNHGFKVNAFRTAVPTPETSAGMPPLELQSQHLRRQPMAGRKRSRADVFEEDSSDPHSASSSEGNSSSPNKIFRTDEEALNASEQNGVRAEELAEKLRASAFADASGRPPALEARKSIRLDPDATDIERHQLQLQNNEMLIEQESPAQAVGISDHQRGPSGHDEASLTLGVGWASIPATPLMLAAARGWARYVESVFPLRNAKIVWKNEGLNALLVSAVTLEISSQGQLLPGSPGYYLFDESLAQGKLVAKSWERALDNLRAKPMQYDGLGIMEAENPATNTWADAELSTDRAMGMEID
ncbi:MAG: hypothetical protein Q9162_007262 [Coniocarpon cinnabarinum]